jgi:RNA polymerase sigma-70 factor (ECF subfamily)
VSDFVIGRFAALPLSTDAAANAEVSVEKSLDYEEATDDYLLIRFSNGDQLALAFLLQRYGRLLRSIAARILGNDTEAEDMVQDLYLFIYRKGMIFDSSKSSARSWIVQMLYHRTIERRRYLSTRQFYSHKEVEGISEQVVGAATTESDYSEEAVFGRNGLERVFKSLSKDQRETLRLYFFEGYTLAEIGKKLGQPHGNVRHHYYRGLALLRKHMAGSNVRVVEPYGK